MPQEVHGPLCLWPFPLLNMFLSMMSQQQSRYLSRLGRFQQTSNNEEVWELVRDEKGRLVNVVVHRKVVQT